MLITKVNAATGTVETVEVPDEPIVVTSEMIDAERDRRTDAGFAWNGTRFQTRPQDRENIAGATILAIGALAMGADPQSLLWHMPEDGVTPFGWIAEDNTIMPMTAPEMVAFGRAAAGMKSYLIFKARALKDDPPADFTADEYWA